VVLNYLVSGFLDLLAYSWRLHQGGIEVNNKLPTTRPWWLNKYTAWYLAGVAGLVAGCVVLLYAPEFAAWWVKS
jgi:hypothetical protein